ncbi:DUF6311 domain-containing protein [Dokdonella sp. MW10]|uniref:DUF6311 domain-containing protein n=1 Tax=Dokdonella sp. MW10 TaxID=2992926 RepID=UPI003F7D49C2
MCLTLPASAWPIMRMWLQDGGLPAALSPIFARDIASVLVITALLALAGLSMIRSNRFDARGAFVLGSLYGSAVFMRDVGSALLDPTSINWLLAGDLGQHYGGWEMFRDAPWAWPPGKTTTLTYPIGTSVVYTDSLPLFAFLFKPLSTWLPPTFQYIGLWMFVSYTLLGGFAALLMRRVCASPPVVVIAAALFVSAPIMATRFNHDTLTAQWLLLAALWLYASTTTAPSTRGVVARWRWRSLAVVSALVHPYFPAMVLPIFAAALVHRGVIQRALGWRRALLELLIAVVVVLVTWWLSGAFIIRDSASLSGVQYGYYSFNLLGFLNPLDNSRHIPSIPVGPGQYEGSAWPGAGMWLVFLLAAGLALARWRNATATVRGHWPLAASMLAMTAFATSTVVVLGPHVLVDAPIDNPFIAMYRSSGRFIWPLYYLLFFVSLALVARRFGTSAATGMLVVALAVQQFDSNQSMGYALVKRSVTLQAPEGSLLRDPRWNTLATDRRHLVVLPARGCGPNDIFMPFLMLAAQHRMTLNSAYLARIDSGKLASYCTSLGEQLTRVDLRADELYVIVDEPWMTRFPEARARMRCETLDGHAACTAPMPGDDATTR